MSQKTIDFTVIIILNLYCLQCCKASAATELLSVKQAICYRWEVWLQRAAFISRLQLHNWWWRNGILHCFCASDNNLRLLQVSIRFSSRWHVPRNLFSQAGYTCNTFTSFSSGILCCCCCILMLPNVVCVDLSGLCPPTQGCRIYFKGGRT